MCIATFLFSILIHLNTKSTVVICIYNISEKRSKILLNIFLFHVDLAHYQEAKRTEFIHSLINCGQTFQEPPNSLLKARLQIHVFGTSVGRQFWTYETKCINVVWQCVKSVWIWSYSDPYSVGIWKNTDQSSFEYGHFLGSVIFYLASPIYCVKYWKVSCCIFSQYCKTIFWTSSKSFKKITKVRRHSSVPRASILNISYKCIFIVLFSVSFNYMFVWNNKELGSL